MASTATRNFELEANALLDLDRDAQRVYADWLLSIGDPRGELISLEIHCRDGYRSQRHRLRAEVAAREASFRAAWEAWADERGLKPGHVRLRQGFVVDIGLSEAELGEAGAALFEREPIQRLTIKRATNEGLARVCRQHGDELGRLRYLKIEGELGAAAVAAIAELGFVGLERLNLLETGLDAAACSGLAKLDAPGLTHLTLTANDIDDAGIEALLDGPAKSSWRALYLSGNPVGAGGLTMLAKDGGLDQLEQLYLRQIDASFAAFEALLAEGALPACQHLEVSNRGSWHQRGIRDRLSERFATFSLR